MFSDPTKIQSEFGQDNLFKLWGLYKNLHIMFHYINKRNEMRLLITFGVLILNYEKWIALILIFFRLTKKQ